MWGGDLGMADQDSKPSRPTMWCLDCDYVLDGLNENRCPECGREFDRSDVHSFRRAPKTFVARVGVYALWLGIFSVFMWFLAYEIRTIKMADSYTTTMVLMFSRLGIGSGILAIILGVVGVRSLASDIGTKEQAFFAVIFGLVSFLILLFGPALFIAHK
jgi:uncharacterized paraquat-inducible protein A